MNVPIICIVYYITNNKQDTRKYFSINFKVYECAGKSCVQIFLSILYIYAEVITCL